MRCLGELKNLKAQSVLVMQKSGNVEMNVSHADEISSDFLSPTTGTYCNAVFTLEQRFEVFFNYFSIIG